MIELKSFFVKQKTSAKIYFYSYHSSNEVFYEYCLQDYKKELSEHTQLIWIIDFCKFLFPTNIFSLLVLILLLYVIKGH